MFGLLWSYNKIELDMKFEFSYGNDIILAAKIVVVLTWHYEVLGYEKKKTWWTSYIDYYECIS